MFRLSVFEESRYSIEFTSASLSLVEAWPTGPGMDGAMRTDSIDDPQAKISALLPRKFWGVDHEFSQAIVLNLST